MWYTCDIRLYLDGIKFSCTMVVLGGAMVVLCFNWRY